jgi:23S rRNA (cytidine1920-2'-O)/16S rRNA (cytidine1409-2'-O)-methyltransferase
MMGEQKKRLDVLVTERGLAESRSQAQRLILAGSVRVDDEVIAEPARKIAVDADVSLDAGPRFVSRGGEKLEPALIAFGLTRLAGRTCADVGASTGGFTDCLLRYGAKKVYAIDVGYGILHWQLRIDPRVVVMERTNARYLETLPEPVSLVTMDASFISLKLLLPVVKNWIATSGGDVVALIKPQFEAGRSEVKRGEGVIQDPEVHRKVLEEVLAFGQGIGFAVRGLVRSPLKGPKGNVEFLAHLGFPGGEEEDLQRFVASVLA